MGDLQGLAVNWIFSFRIKFVGLEPICWPHQWWAEPDGSGHFGWSLGGSLGEQAVFKKNTFLLETRHIIFVLFSH